MTRASAVIAWSSGGIVAAAAAMSGFFYFNLTTGLWVSDPSLIRGPGGARQQAQSTPEPGMPVSGQSTPPADIAEPRNLSGVWWGGASTMPYQLEIVGQAPALTPEGQAKYQESHQLKTAIDDAMDNPFDVAKCTLVGVPRIWAQAFPFEITQKPGLTVIIYEHMHTFRNVLMGQAPYTLDNALALNRNGNSVGRWEGDTLIIESTAFNPLGMLDETGLPQTEALRVVERLRKLDNDTLEVVATMEDPAYYVRPWTVRATYTHRPDVRLAEYVCGYGHFEHRYTGGE